MYKKYKSSRDYNIALSLLFDGNIKAKEFSGTKVKTAHKCKKHSIIYYSTPYHVEKSATGSCPRCAGEAISKRKTRSTKDYAMILKEKFGDLITIKEKYTNGAKLHKHHCKKHGFFLQTPSYIVQGSVTYACQKCAGQSKLRSSNTESYIEKLKHVRPNLVPLAEYQGAYSTILHKCIVHDVEFNATPYSLYGSKGFGCPECLNEFRQAGCGRRKTNETFLKQLEEIHKGRIQLITPKYLGALKIHDFRCECGHEWKTIASSLVRPLKFSGCPACSSKQVSKPEIELYQWIKNIFPDAVQSYRKVSSTRMQRNFEIDIFIPSMSFGIEFNGLYYHSYPNKPKWYHSEKTECCAKVGIKLIHIYEDDWKFKKSVVKKTIRHLLGKTTKKYFARKLTIKHVNRITPMLKEFYNNNHMQGCPRHGVTYGLFENTKLVAAMTFCAIQSIRGRASSNKESELIRYASIGSVVGGASRLFSHYLKSNLLVKNILSYSDNGLFDGKIYEKLGFNLLTNVRPEYSTVWKEVRKHKSSTKRDNLAKLLPNFNPDLSEMQNLIKNSIPIIFDCGKKKWMFTKK